MHFIKLDSVDFKNFIGRFLGDDPSVENLLKNSSLFELIINYLIIKSETDFSSVSKELLENPLKNKCLFHNFIYFEN